MAPVTGAADAGSGVQESGRWPSPANRPGRRVETDPTGSRQVHLGPGVQIGEILFRPRRAVQGFDVSGELDQIAGDKSRSESKMTQQLNEQPARVAARARPFDKRLLRRLHARLHADQVFDVTGELTVELD